MGVIASHITSLTIVYSTVYSYADQRKHQSSASLAFVQGIHRGPVNSPHKWPVTQKMFPFDDVIMKRWYVWELDRHWFRWWLVACLTQNIVQPNVDLSQHYNDVIGSQITGYSTVYSIADVKENIKALHYWTFWWGSTGERGSPHKDPAMQKTFPCNAFFVNSLNHKTPKNKLLWKFSQNSDVVIQNIF